MNKFGARKTKLYGITFDSAAEARRYLVNLDRQERGEIKSLKVHPAYRIIPAFTHRGEKYREAIYTADFSYIECGTGAVVVEDVKGGRATKTEAFMLRAKLFRYMYPDIDFRVIEA